MNPFSGTRNPALDGIRGLAILWVFAFHADALLVGAAADGASGWGQALARKGLLGVQLFFVLSGFLLAGPWMKAAAQGLPGPAIGRFFARRARRILPAYWLHLALLFGVVLPLLRGGYAVLGTDVGQANLWLHIPLMQFLHPGSSTSLGLNMALWSLGIEAQFYLLLPLLAPLFVRDRVLIALPSAILVALLWKGLAPDLLSEWVYLNVAPSRLVFFDPLSGQAGPFPPEMMRLFLERQLPGELASFALGMSAANLAVRLDAHPRGVGWRRSLDIAGLVVLVLSALLPIALPDQAIIGGVGWRLWGMPLFLLGCAILVLAAACRTPWIDRILAAPIPALIGVISYSLFLWHEPVLRLVAAARLTSGACTAAPCRIALALALALLVATLSYALTERRRPNAGR